MCEMMHCFYWRRNWWIWNSFVSSSIPHWQCNKQTPVEGALLCWSFNLLSIFQLRFVSFPYFRVLMLTLVGETCRWYETTSFLPGLSTCRSINRFLSRELCYVEVWCLPLFPSSGLAFSAYYSVSVLKLMRQSFIAYENIASPLACPIGRSPNKSLQRALQRRSLMSVHVFSDQVWLFNLPQCLCAETDERFL